MKIRLLTLAVAASAVVAISASAAPICSVLASPGATYCASFTYSTGGSNSYTAAFGTGNNFNLNGNSPGTFICSAGYIETDYKFSGIESQQWYGKVAAAGGGGFGKSLTNGYYYKFKLSPGACPVAHAGGATQNVVK